MKNPYEVLGVPTNASIAEIKSAFRSLAKATHPDVNGGNPELTAKFRDVAEAYAVLSDPEKRILGISIIKIECFRRQNLIVLRFTIAVFVLLQ